MTTFWRVGAAILPCAQNMLCTHRAAIEESYDRGKKKPRRSAGQSKYIFRAYLIGQSDRFGSFPTPGAKAADLFIRPQNHFFYPFILINRATATHAVHFILYNPVILTVLAALFPGISPWQPSLLANASASIAPTMRGPYSVPPV